MRKRRTNVPLTGGSNEPAQSSHPGDLPVPVLNEEPCVIPGHGTPLTAEETARAIKDAATRKVGRTDFQQTDSSNDK